MNRAVWKYVLPIHDWPSLAMPEGARVVAVAEQGEALCLWADVDTDAPLCVRQFRLAGTGHPLGPVGDHLGTVLLMGGRLVLHLYDIPSPPKESLK